VGSGLCDYDLVDGQACEWGLVDGQACEWGLVDEGEVEGNRRRFVDLGNEKLPGKSDEA